MGILFYLLSMHLHAQLNSSIYATLSREEHYIESQLKPVRYFQAGENRDVSEFSLFAILMLDIYKTGFSPSIGGGCYFTPSCSAYSFEAFHQKGFIVGLFLTLDRMVRCNRKALLENDHHLLEPRNGLFNDHVEDR